MTSRDPNDTLSEAGARQLATAIERYWHSRGHSGVKVTVEHATLLGAASKSGTHGSVHVIRSNLIGGLPASES